MLFITRWLRTLQRLFKRTPRTTLPPPLPDPLPAIITEPPPPAPIVTEISSNRHERLALERARRKHDKFVVPQGKIPEKPKPETPDPKSPRRKHIEVITPADTVPDNEMLIADSHHENRSEIVAYKEQELYGEFNFRDTILQQLECYFVYLARMKKHDPESYGFYKEVGATLMPYLATGSWYRDDRLTPEDIKKDLEMTTPLADWFNQTRPTFGCYVYGADPETEKYEKAGRTKVGKETKDLWVPKFMYYRKYRRPPPEVQLISGGDIYAMVMYWDRPFDKKFKHGRPSEFCIFVSKDGKEVIALRNCDTELVPVRHKKNGYDPKTGTRYKRGQMFSVPQRGYHLPCEFEKWAKENGEDPQHFLTEIFKRTVQRVEMSQLSMTRVTATKDGMTAAFSVNIHRTAYFFSDRDVQLTDDGKRRRVFHFVKPHVRHDGTTVKAHFRGERQFTWGGYEVEITIPGKHHFDIADVDIGLHDEYWEDDKREYLHMPELGKQLKTWMKEGRGKRA